MHSAWELSLLFHSPESCVSIPLDMTFQYLIDRDWTSDVRGARREFSHNFLLRGSRNSFSHPLYKMRKEKLPDQLWTNQQLEIKRRNILRKKKEEDYNAFANSWDRISILFTHHQGIWTFSILKLNSARN